jgi:Xaa-Pro dipeptidase
MNVAAIQNALRERGYDAWLFYDHHHRDPIAYKILGLPNDLHCTRRWYYLIPASGEPLKLNHRVEPKHLEHLPGKQEHYGPWPELHEKLKKMIAPYKKIAMQYSKDNNIMLLSLVDAGTIELLRKFGAQIESSSNLVAQFEATLTDAQIESHFAARDKVDRIMEAAFKEAGTRSRSGGINEYQLQQWLGEAFKREGLVTDDLPIVGVNENGGNPHYSPEASGSKPIREGDWLLLDMWAKLDRPDAVFYDITWCGFLGKTPSDRHREIFEIVKQARDAGIKTAQDAFAAKRKIEGWEVDVATRAVIDKAGYGEYFVHRTGHSIGTEVHGNGANMDNLETKDDREILPNTLFSIEPGIYLPEFGVRLEVDMMVRKGAAEVTGRIQREIVLV